MILIWIYLYIGTVVGSLVGLSLAGVMRWPDMPKARLRSGPAADHPGAVVLTALLLVFLWPILIGVRFVRKRYCYER